MLIIKPDSDIQVSNMLEISPENIKYTNAKRIFLGGTIENGTAEDWQKVVCEYFKNDDVIFFNPRRNVWNSNLEQSSYDRQFNYQVNWELDHLEMSDIILMNFIRDTKSPISLLELGMYSKSGKMIVCCPEEFWRVGNVEIICQRTRTPLYTNLRPGISHILTNISMNTHG